MLSVVALLAAQHSSNSVLPAFSLSMTTCNEDVENTLAVSSFVNEAHSA